MHLTPPEPARSHRQLQVGEALRHAIAEFFLEYSFYEGVLKGQSVTISEVRVSPDLKNATVFATVLGGNTPEGFIPALNAIAHEIKRHIAKSVRLRYVPALLFKKDEQFLQADHLERLIDEATRNLPKDE